MNNIDISKNEIMVSVICTTYNHEAYIRDALEGFIKQETTFPIEIIVHDDASTDKTAEIVKEYELKYPKLFKNIYQKENLYSKGNGDVGKIVFNVAQGKYVAICEGDDYWIDPYKLQKQVDFLESNTDYGLVHSDFDWFDVEKNEFVYSFYKSNNINILSGSTLKNYEEYGNIRTVTVCFRKTLLNEYLNKYLTVSIENKWLLGDFPLFLYITHKSKIGYIDESTSVYRRLAESASSSLDINKKLEFLESTYNIHLYFIKEFSLGEEIYFKRQTEFLKWRLFYLNKLKKFSEIKDCSRLIDRKDLTLIEILIIFGSTNMINYHVCNLLINFNKVYMKIKKRTKKFIYS